VIAAPFGPWEEGRFVWSLFQSWLADRPAVVRTPDYVRDNLPAPLLGLSYARFLGDLLANPNSDQVARPSGFVGSQGAFARKVASEARARLGRPCEVVDAVQAGWPEPYLRINSDPVRDPGWDEARFWDSYVSYYVELDARGLLASTAP
jgi:hypothetical protein